MNTTNKTLIVDVTVDIVYIEQLRDLITSPKSDLKETFNLLIGELEPWITDIYSVRLSNVSHQITHVWFNEETQSFQAEIEFLNTPNGRILQETCQNDAMKFSECYHLRPRLIGERDGKSIPTITDVITYDIFLV
jgi:hypothetical protein